MDAATIAQQIRTADSKATAQDIADGLKGQALAAVADELNVELYGTADNRRRLVAQFGYGYHANRAAIMRRA